MATLFFDSLALPHDQVGQPGGNAGNQADQEHGQEHQQQEWHDAPDRILERNIGRDVLDMAGSIFLNSEPHSIFR
jgi:hypothetical protein